MESFGAPVSFNGNSCSGQAILGGSCSTTTPCYNYPGNNYHWCCYYLSYESISITIKITQSFILLFITLHLGVNYVAVDTTTPIVASCSSTYSTSGKYIITPNYPSNYGNGVNCNWIITSPIGTTIKLIFDYFYTESTRDMLTIYDGPSPNDGFNRYTFTDVGPFADFESAGNSLYLKFESDYSITYKGFKLFYSWEGKNLKAHLYIYI